MKQFILPYFGVLFCTFFCVGSYAQKCDSLQWTSPSFFEHSLSEQEPMIASHDTMSVKLGYNCSQTLSEAALELWIDEELQPKHKVRVVNIVKQSAKILLTLTPGKHKIQVKAGKVSSRVIWIKYEGMSDLHVLSIGVPQKDLKYTYHDAHDITATFEALRGKNLFGDIHLMCVDTGKTSKSDIRGQLKGLYSQYKAGQIRSFDFVVVFLSSHGFVYKDTFYLQCKGYDNDTIKLKEYNLSADEIVGILNEIPCKKLLLLDACYSGAATQSVPTYAAKGYVYEQALKTLSQRINGLAVLTAANRGEEAAEDARWKNGVFTEAIQKALKDGKADTDKDGMITLNELGQYVQNEVNSLVKLIHPNKAQHPTFDLGNIPSVTPIFALKTIPKEEDLAKQFLQEIAQGKEAFWANNYPVAFILLDRHKIHPSFDAEAQFAYGYMLEYGEGTSSNPDLALTYYLKAAQTGFAKAQRNAGSLYYTKQDYANALLWTQKAAAQNDAIALKNMGLFYRDGVVLARDYQKSFESFLKAAELGNSMAEYYVGVMYYWGEYVEKSDKLCFEWYEKAAMHGYDWAQYNLAIKYQDGLGTKANPVEAFKWLEKAAKQKRASAQRLLGYYYEKGIGTEMDYKQALYYYELAANQQYVAAYLDLGLMHENGQGTKVDYQKAKYYYELAAKNNNDGGYNGLGGLYRMGLGVSVDYSKAKTYFEKAIELGGTAAYINLGQMYYLGQGVEKNYKHAFSLFQQAAIKGDVNAWLGVLYGKGEGVEQNLDSAFKYTSLAAKKNDLEAICNLGICYQDAKGVAKDEKMAFDCYLKSAELGSNRGMLCVGNAYEHGMGVKENYKEALKWYEKAAMQNYADGQVQLAYMYVNGLGVKKNYKIAKEWYEKAVKQNHATAQYNLGILYEYGDGVPKNLPEAIRLYRLAAKQGNEYAKKALARLGEKEE